jgi:putative glycosyltransferase (TIGR04348 family)
VARPSIVIVSPALADANNGNWQTARRWQRLLAPTHAVRIVTDWPGEGPQALAQARRDVGMLALHARRSASAISAWARAHAARGQVAPGLAVVLTGTDLYHDILRDAQARRSLDRAERLVVLQAQGLQAVPLAHRARARVIYQSTPARAPVDKTGRWLRVVCVGHLRAVKSPQTLMQAARLLTDRPDIRLDHIGEALAPEWAEAARATEADAPHYRWLGPLPHARARAAIGRAHLLVNTSAMEGGAHVVMEAVRCGTPVLASRVGGNVGMLGADYEGYFPHDDAQSLARLLARCRDEQADPDGLPARLARQCALRAPLFDPETERAALLQLIDELTAPAALAAPTSAPLAAPSSSNAANA